MMWLAVFAATIVMVAAIVVIAVEGNVRRYRDRPPPHSGPQSGRRMWE